MVWRASPLVLPLKHGLVVVGGTAYGLKAHGTHILVVGDGRGGDGGDDGNGGDGGDGDGGWWVVVGGWWWWYHKGQS